MTRARSTQISITDTPYYHCVSRCVRRAYLCGTDHHSGKSYSHRKQWIIDRLAHISTVYTIDICAYTIMENHYHLIVKVDEQRAQYLTDKEVITQWMQLYNGDVLMNRYLNGECHSEAELDKVNDIIQQWRLRLSDLSWFMRSLNEYIARKANEEDNCKGHFWESRFKSQALLNEQALLSCMTYVDLNPIRAGVTERLEESDFTSIQQRINDYSQQVSKHKATQKQNKPAKIIPLAGFSHQDDEHKKTKTTKKPESDSSCSDINSDHNRHDNKQHIPYSLKDYFELTDWTGRAIRDDKRGYIPDKEPKLLSKLGIDPAIWLESVKDYSTQHQTFIGSEAQLKKVCQKTGKKWLSGIKKSRVLYADH